MIQSGSRFQDKMSTVAIWWIGIGTWRSVLVLSMSIVPLTRYRAIRCPRHQVGEENRPPTTPITKCLIEQMLVHNPNTPIFTITVVLDSELEHCALPM